MQQHQLEWTPERIQIFWDQYTSNEAHAGVYFSRLFGRSLIAYVRRRIHIGTPLDYGCGRGDFLSYLADAGCTELYGVEQSPESRDAVLRRIGSRAAIHLSVEPKPQSADTAFLIEVVEHMDDVALDAAFEQVRRALKSGGHLVITTPNDEDLAANSVLCPECLAVFHVMQHVRSWNATSLRKYAESHGFQTLSIEATILSPHAGIVDRLWRMAKRALGATPNLIYIGRKD
jgi:SAM-dependent methyltransferase